MSGIIRKKNAGEAWETVVDDGGSGGSGPILSASVDLTSAQIADLGDTPVEVIAAVPGRVIIPVGGSFEYFAGSERFGNSLINGALAAGANTLLSVRSPLETDDAVNLCGPADNSPETVRGDALVISSDDPVGFVGPILTTSLTEAGSFFAPGDTGDVTSSGAGTGGLLTVSTVANSFAINQVNQGAKTFRLTGDATAFQAGDTLTVYRSTGNDGTYEISTVGAFTGGNTLITLDSGESIPSAVADGRAGDAALGNVGSILTYALTNGGSGYVVASDNAVEAVAPSTGEGWEIDIDSVAPASDGTARVTVYYAVTDAV